MKSVTQLLTNDCVRPPRPVWPTDAIARHKKQIAVQSFDSNRTRLQTTSTTSSLPPGGVGRNRRHILDPSNLQPSPGQRPERTLGSRSGGLGPGSSSGPQLDVQRVDTQLLDPGGNVLSGKHRSVRRGLITVSLDLHSSRHTAEGFLSGQIRDVDKGIVERREDVRHAPHELSLPVVRTNDAKTTREDPTFTRFQGTHFDQSPPPDARQHQHAPWSAAM